MTDQSLLQAAVPALSRIGSAPRVGIDAAAADLLAVRQLLEDGADFRAAAEQLAIDLMRGQEGESIWLGFMLGSPLFDAFVRLDLKGILAPHAYLPNVWSLAARVELAA